MPVNYMFTPPALPPNSYQGLPLRDLAGSASRVLPASEPLSLGSRLQGRHAPEASNHLPVPSSMYPPPLKVPVCLPRSRAVPVATVQGHHLDPPSFFVDVPPSTLPSLLQRRARPPLRIATGVPPKALVPEKRVVGGFPPPPSRPSAGHQQQARLPYPSTWNWVSFMFLPVTAVQY
jgi:hypothetical protein